MHVDEYIQLIIETPVVVLVENLQPDEHVEDEGAHFFLGVREELGPSEVEDEGRDNLIYCLSDDHFPHCEGDYAGGAGGWRAVEDFVGGEVGAEGEGG
jgi:hypothetical protein